MSGVVEYGFKRFLKSLEPSTKESNAERGARSTIQECLRQHHNLIEFRRIGSFKGATAINGFSDIDFLAIFPKSKLDRNSQHVLESIKYTLDRRLRSANIEINSPALTVEIYGALRSRTEIVPADLVRRHGAFNIYEIPTWDGNWMETSPDAHYDYVRQADYHTGYVRNITKLLKAWKYLNNIPVVSCFLELSAAEYAIEQSNWTYDSTNSRFERSMQREGPRKYLQEHPRFQRATLAQHLPAVFRGIFNTSLVALEDPTGICGFIEPCAHTDKEIIESKMLDAIRQISAARYAEREGLFQEAFDEWNKFFNGKFPEIDYNVFDDTF